MTMISEQSFQPSWVSPPGDTIMDLLSNRELRHDEFTQLLGTTPDVSQSLLDGNKIIDFETATRLAAIFDVPASFWIERERIYRKDLEKLSSDISFEEKNWLKKVPLSSMQELGWIPETQGPYHALRHCFDFFDVKNIGAWETIFEQNFQATAYKTSPSFKQDLASVSAWLRKGEIEAGKLTIEKWNKKGFENSLDEIRKLTNEADPEIFLPMVQDICSKNGVAVTAIRAPSGCRASGATKFISENKALIILSFRHLTDDHFWFSFFHEAAHLILHSIDKLFIEGYIENKDQKEKEANSYAANMLIPIEYQKQLADLPQNYRSIIKFSKKIGVSPGIVVGQLQHKGYLPYSHMNKLKARYSF